MYHPVLWNVFGECKNYNVLLGHKNAVLEAKWCQNGTNLVSCSADKTVCYWDGNKGKRVRRFSEHGGIVNCCSVVRDGSEIFASGSDDCSVILWDSRNKHSAGILYHDYQVTSVCLSSDGYQLFSGGIDNIIR